jgi:hypothetical protein
MNHFFDIQTLILKLSGLRSRGKVVDFLFPFGELAEIRIEQFVETLSIVIEVCESFVATIQKFTVSDDTLFIHISEIKALVSLRNDGPEGTEKYPLKKLKDTRRRISNPSSNLGAVALRILDDDFKLVSLTDELKATLGIADDDVPSISFLFADVWSEILQRSFNRKGSYRIFPIGVSKFWSPDDLFNAAKVDQDYSTDQSAKFEVAHQTEPILLIRLGDQISTSELEYTLSSNASQFKCIVVYQTLENIDQVRQICTRYGVVFSKESILHFCDQWVMDLPSGVVPRMNREEIVGHLDSNDDLKYLVQGQEDKNARLFHVEGLLTSINQGISQSKIESNLLVFVPANIAPRAVDHELKSRRKRSEQRRPVVIAAPNFGTSAGVRMLYRLCTELNIRGHHSAILNLQAGQKIQSPIDVPEALQVFSENEFRDAVLIRPETMRVPMHQGPTVEWLLNHPERLPQSIDVGKYEKIKADFTFTYSRIFSETLPRLYLNPVDFSIFYPKKFPGKAKALYLGKATIDQSFQLPSWLNRDEMILIERDWPKNSFALAALLRSIDVLYSCDPISSLNTEAALCGTPVVIIPRVADFDEFEEAQKFDFGVPGFTTLHSDEGIEIARQSLENIFDSYRDSVNAAETGDLEYFSRFIADI